MLPTGVADEMVTGSVTVVAPQWYDPSIDDGLVAMADSVTVQTEPSRMAVEGPVSVAAPAPTRDQEPLTVVAPSVHDQPPE